MFEKAKVFKSPGNLVLCATITFLCCLVEPMSLIVTCTMIQQDRLYHEAKYDKIHRNAKKTHNLERRPFLSSQRKKMSCQLPILSLGSSIESSQARTLDDRHLKFFPPKLLPTALSICDTIFSCRSHILHGLGNTPCA